MAWLAVSWPDGRTDSIELTHRKPISIGSHPSSNVVIDDDDLPALACRIAWNGSDYEAVAAADDDILVNDKRSRRRTLSNKDELKVGSVTLLLHRGLPPKERPPEKDDSKVSEPPPPPKRVDPEPDEEDFGDEFDEDFEMLEEKDETPKRTAQSKIRERLHARARRPGEQDAMRSPLVYGMAGGVVVLVVATLALTIFLRGQSIQQQFQAAMAAHSAGRYADAEREFDRFIKRHPAHSLTPKARRQLALTHVDRVIRAGVPVWPQGFKLLNDVISRFRDDSDFEVVHSDIAERAGLIALGAATDAGKNREPDLIPLSEQAEAMLAKYSPDAVAPETLIQQIVRIRTESRNRLVQLDVLDDYLDRMKQAAEAERHLHVLEIAGQLAKAEPDLVTEKPVQEYAETALAAARELVQLLESEDLTSSGASTPAASPWTVATVAVIDRPAGEAKPDGRPLFVWHDESYFAADKSSGDPIWVRQLPGSFSPVPIEVPSPGAIAYLRESHSVALLSETDGQNVSVVALPESASMPVRPRVAGPVAFLPVGSKLLRVDLDSQRIDSGLEFGQPIVSEPGLVETPAGQALVVVGHSQLIYLVDPRSLELIDTFRLGHPPGSIIAAPTVAAEFMLLAENDPAGNRSRITMLTTVGDALEDLRMRLIDRSAVVGLVVDSPVLRGRDLFVASTPERVTVLTVSDEDGGQLTRGDSFNAGRDSDDPVPTYLLAGADREFWMAGRRLIRLRATGEAIRAMGEPIPLSVPVQPPISSGSDVYVAARRSADTTATLSRVDGQQYRERWQLQLGADVVGVLPADSGSEVTAVTERGDVCRVKAGHSGFVTQVSSDIGSRVLSSCLSGQRLAAATAEGVAWIGKTGRVERQAKLATSPIAPIADWNGAVVVPVLGKLHVLDSNGRPALADFWLEQDNGQPPRWKSVSVIDENHLLTVDTSNIIRVLTRVDGDTPHLAETANREIDGISMAVVSGSDVFVTTATTASVLDALSLADSRTEIASLGKIDQIESIQSIGDEVLIVARAGDGRRLRSLTDERSIAVESPIIGTMIGIDDQLVVTTTHEVLRLDAATLQVNESIKLPTEAAGSARLSANSIVVPLQDGSIATLKTTAD